jgi:hypothetical protein
MHEYYNLRPAKALTNALERLMIAISAQEMEQNFNLLIEYRKACELLGYDPAMTQWSNVEGVGIASGPDLAEEVTVNYFPQLNPEE